MSDCRTARESYQTPGDAVGRDLRRSKIMTDDDVVGAEDDHRRHLNQEE